MDHIDIILQVYYSFLNRDNLARLVYFPSQSFEHFCGRFSCDRMTVICRDLGKRSQHKCAFVDSRMRDLKIRVVNDLVFIVQDVKYTAVA